MSLDRYLAGDDSALDDAVIELMPLVDEFTQSFLKKAPGFIHLEDDLKSEGYLMLVTAIPKMKSSASMSILKFNHRAYLRRAFKNVASQVVRGEENLSMPLRTWRRKTKSGEDVPFVSSDQFALESAVVDDTPVHDLRETIYDCCHSAEERMIVDMREKGFAYKEIATELGMSTGQVHNYLNAIYTRLQKEIQS